MQTVGDAPADAPLREVILRSKSGSITRSPYQVQYTDGQEVTFTASPASGYLFAGWSGAMGGTANPAALTVAGDIDLTGSFVAEDGYVAWAMTHFGSEAAAPSHVMKRGRMIPIEEAFLLGADPYNPQDVATARMQEAAEGGLHVRIHGLPGRQYQLQSSATLQSDDWLPASPVVSGQDALIEWSVSPGEDPPFYRIEILPDE